jgi:hypothetical protein
MTIQNNVVFAYVKIQSPVKSLNEGDTEFTVDCVMSKADAKAWNKEHPKNKYKSFDNDEFLEKYNFDDVPFDDQDEQFIVKFKKAHSKKGVELPEKFRPRVFVLDEDGKAVDKTFEILVANNSKGKVSFSKFSNSYGEFVQLDAILVEELIEYQSKGGTPGSEFGVTELAAVPKNQKVVQKQGEDDDEEEDEKPVKPVKKAAKKVVVEDDDEISDSPF